TGAEPLAANEGLSSFGVMLAGRGFIVSPEEAARLGLGRVEGIERHLRPTLNGRDLTAVPRDRYVIDFYGLDADEARRAFPEAFEHLVREVKPEREKNRRKSIRENWWLFGEKRPALRRALEGLPRYIATPETAKHRVFQFLASEILPEHKIIAIALDDAYHLGVLSSAVHVEWALAAGGTLEDRPVYNTTTCFKPFPFPDPTEEQRERIRALGEAIDAHRKRQQALHPALTLTALYNAVEALRAGRQPTGKDAEAAEQGLAHTLLDLHRRLDRAVLDAYGWADPSAGSGQALDPEAPTFRAAVLARLVALNAARRAEERAGRIRYLRPAFQAPADATQAGFDLPPAPAPPSVDGAPRRPWPDTFAAR